ncbi:axonemal protein, partial [Trichonephila clavata]
TWELSKGAEKNTALLTITGMQVAIKINIAKEGCCIQQIERDGKFLFSSCYSIWMNPDGLIKKLLSMGMNIAVEKDISNFIEITPKNAELENWTYSCMSILCHAFNFYWSRWNVAVQSDQLVMRYNFAEDEKDKFTNVLLTPGKAVEIKCTESNTKFSDEPLEGQNYFSNLYHLLMERNEVESSEKIDYEFVNNIFFLLNSSKLFSCS